MKNLIVDVTGGIVILGPLIAICALHWRKPWLFSSFGRCALWILGLSLWSWLLFGGSVFVACAWLHDYPENGAAVAFALCFGWFYIWPFAIVVGIIYMLVRMLAGLFGWINRRLFTHQ